VRAEPGGTVGKQTEDFDVLIIGSGFGGSVTALRLAEKGYRVGVLEAGGASGPTTTPAATGTCGATCGCPL